MFDPAETVKKDTTYTENFYLEYEIDYMACSSIWKVSRRVRKLGVKEPLGEPIGEIKYLTKDEYAECSQILNFDEGLTDDEYKELLSFTNEMQFALGVYFISLISTYYTGDGLVMALKNIGYETDPEDQKLVLVKPHKSLLYPAPLVGVLLGLIFAYLTHQNFLWGAAIGLALGSITGITDDIFKKHKREEMLRKRRDRNL